MANENEVVMTEEQIQKAAILLSKKDFPDFENYSESNQETFVAKRASEIRRFVEIMQCIVEVVDNEQG
jgi:hypothetical protein